MVEENNAIAIIPGDCFRWRARVQFMESFQTRTAALDFAFEHGYNLIVERNEGSNALFDVLQDPDGACTADLKLELLTNEEVLVEADSTSWTVLMFMTFWNLARRLGAAGTSLYVHEVDPILRQAVSRQWWANIQRVFRLAWYRHMHWGIRNFRRRLGSAASLYHSGIAPHCRHTASRYWWSGSAVDFRRWLYRHSQGGVRDLAKRFVAIMASLYNREVEPWLRQTASRIRQADYGAAIRRAWSISLSTISTLARQFAVAMARTYTREVAPRLRHVAVRCWWSGRAVDFRRLLHRHLQGGGQDLAKRLPAVMANLYSREIAPHLRQAARTVRQADYEGAFRRAWSVSFSTVSGITRRFGAVMTALYQQRLVPIFRHAAASYNQAEIEEALCRSIGAVAPPQHSNSSQLG